ncbi:hypothetical protein BDA96_03G445700 [Sorghum bicolor]|uniref:Uncharacterized protein n=2 Tax=Sorghum bicolor TaxID=4558 RepID=A0A921RK70_SORBI|nr:uncharacterized protein LOC8081304 [Sorghum bicolor]EES04149.1 hypothetical protein SORBI_3003G413400 [Sorghum bicolor]KAG0540861.1 hypothetical protein BDA96_03G445700 [Sorghum bicolor]|eukprot:XP_002459029.1 uncharacterized protein LOC8081304 [Sorghum bicolor]
MKAVAAMTMTLLLLALVHHAAGSGHHQGHIWKHDDAGHQYRSSSPLAGLTQCVTICGSGVTSCMLDCYQPLIDLDPVELPVCLLKCTNDAMVCASGCPVNGNGV